MAGRICLVKLVFTSLSLYYLSFFMAPKTVCDRIINIQRRFLWGWGRENKSISLEEGGLGIKDVRNFNCAILAK